MDTAGPLLDSLLGRDEYLVMTDYGITVPSYLGVTVKPDIDVTASFKLPGGPP